jgi:glucose-6-phosphate 1-dehydrogenase
VQSEKAAVFQAMRPLAPSDLVRGQYEGYKQENGVAPDSDVETFAAVRLFIDSWRWAGVPFYLRTGKLLPTKACEVLVQMHKPPQKLFDDTPGFDGAGDERGNYVRFMIQPEPAVAIAARVKRPGKGFVGDQKELYLSEKAPGEEPTYARLLGDAMVGDASLFTGQEAVEAAWAVVEPVLVDHSATLPYKPGSWGPSAADALIAGDGGWHNPCEAKDCR